jgi:hypothetical protein
VPEESVSTDTASAYDIAVEFMRLSDILRVRAFAGLDESPAMLTELTNYRYELDLKLATANVIGLWLKTAGAISKHHIP